MARPIPTSFTSYQLSEEEQLKGQVLTTENYYVIQNLICTAAEEKLSLKYDPDNASTYLQREAELQGQIGILRMLLELSLSAQSTLRTAVPANS